MRPNATRQRWQRLLPLVALVVYANPGFAQWSSGEPTAGVGPTPPRVLRHKPPAGAGQTDTAAGNTKPTLLGQYDDWGVYLASASGRKICFASTQPASSETDPADRLRSPIFMFISSRPADKIRNEISIIMGYPFQPKSEAILEVGSVSFALATRLDGAWIKNPAEESSLIDAMRASQNVVLKGKSVKGTSSTDVFALKGLGEALARLAEGCK
jgi:hypothetical protein